MIKPRASVTEDFLQSFRHLEQKRRNDMWKEAWQALVIATAILMYLSVECTLFNELGWQGGLVGSLFFTAFSAAALVGLMYRPPHIDLDEIFGEEENCSPRQ